MLIKKYKYLYYVISFLSLSLSEENRFQTECVEVPEGESRTITCPGNGTISSVDFDSYGLPQGSCQNYQQNDDCYCNPTTDWIGENQVDVLANDELCDNLPLELCAEEQNNRFVQVVCSNIEGCTDDSAVNYNPNADINVDCEYAPEFFDINSTTQSGFEDQTFNFSNLNDFIIDQDSDVLTSILSFEITSNAHKISESSLDAFNLSLTPIDNFYGTVSVRLSIEDVDGHQGNDATFYIYFEPVNDLPVITSVNGQLPIFSEDDGNYSSNINIEVDGDLTIVVEANDDIDNMSFLTYDSDTSTWPTGMLLINDFNYEGIIEYHNQVYNEDFTFTIVVQDSQNENVNLNIDVTVTDNSSPIISIDNHYDKTANEDETYILDFSINNHDQGNININSGIDVIIENISNGNEWYVNPAQIAERENNNEFRITINPDDDWNGTFDILLQVFNSEQLSDVEIIEDIQFVASNDEPVLHNKIDLTNVSETTAYDHYFYLYDIDTDGAYNQNPEDYLVGYTISLINNNDNNISATFLGVTNSSYEDNGENYNMGRFAYSFSNVNSNANWNGTETFIIEYTDGDILESLINQFNVTINQVNDVPIMNVISNITDGVVEDGENVEVQVSATDIDADESLNFEDLHSLSDLTFECSGNDFLECGQTTDTNNNGEATITINLDPDYNKTTIITVNVYDGNGASSATTFKLQIEAVNDKPVIETILPVVFDEEASTTNRIYIYDIDSDSDLNEVPYNYVENMSCVFTFKENTDSESDDQIIFITELGTGQGTHDQGDEEDDITGLHYYIDNSYVANSTNPDVDNENWYGKHFFNVLCDDNSGCFLEDNSCEDDSDFEVEILNINDFPIVTVDDVIMTEDVEEYILITAEDADFDDVFTYRPSNNGHSNISFPDFEDEEEDYTLSISTPLRIKSTDQFNTQGLSFTITAHVYDNHEAETPEDFLLTIAEVNDPPVVSNINGSTDEDVTFTFDFDSNVADDSDICLSNAWFPNDSIICNCNLITQSNCNLDDPEEICGACDYENTQPLTYGIESDPENGEATIPEFSSIVTYVPDPDWHGVDEFIYSASDGEHTVLGTVTLIISPTNDSPTTLPGPILVETNEDGPQPITITGEDIDGDNLEFDITIDPQHGDVSDVTFRQDETVLYTPAANYHGLDSFQYSVTDGSGLTSVREVSITIFSENDTPIADDIEIISNDGAQEDLSFTIDLEEWKDHDDYANVCNTDLIGDEVITCDCSDDIVEGGCDIENENIIYVLGDSPEHGAISITGSEVTYTPNDNNYYGWDSFSYIARDGIDGTLENEGVIDIYLNPVNDSPIVTPVTFSGYEDDEVISIDLNALGNGTLLCDEDGDFLYDVDENQSEIYCDCADLSVIGACDYEQDDLVFDINFLDQPSDNHGTLEPISSQDDPDGSILNFLPGEHVFGDISFTYSVYENGNPSNSSDPENIIITINPINDIPLGTNFDVSVTEDCPAIEVDLLKDLDCNVTNLDGSLFCNCNSFETICTAFNFDDCNLNSYCLWYGLENEGSCANISEGICDVENDDLECYVIEYPNNGTLLDHSDFTIDESPGAVSLRGTEFKYSPNTDYFGSDVMSYKCCDDENELSCSDPRSIIFTIEDENDQPEINNCIDENTDNICDTFIYLDEIITEYIGDDVYEAGDQSISYYNYLYEDCTQDALNPVEDDSSVEYSPQCNEINKWISVNDLRTNLSYTDWDGLCSTSNLWLDNDCVIDVTEENDISFGIAITERDNLCNENSSVCSGRWEYKIDTSFEPMEIIEGCDYLLLDDSTQIRFIPFSNYKSDTCVNDDGDNSCDNQEDPNLLTYPSIIFYAWDQTDGIAPGGCGQFDNGRLDDCGNITTSISEKSLKAFWEVKSVNDVPQIEISNISESFYYNDIEGAIDLDAPDYEHIQLSNVDDELTLTLDEDSLCSSLEECDNDENSKNDLIIIAYDNQDEEGIFAFNDIDSELLFNFDWTNQGIIDIVQQDNKLLFNTVDDMNGTSTLTMTATDSEDAEYIVTIDIEVVVKQINDQVEEFNIDNDISDYSLGDNGFLNDETMFFTNETQQKYIRYPTYFPDSFNYGDESTLEDIGILLQDPESYNLVSKEISYKWDNNQEYIQDVDTNPDLNSADNLYKLYYRLEFLDIDSVFVIKDRINVDDHDFLFSDPEALISIDLRDSFENYILNQTCLPVCDEDNPDLDEPECINFSGSDNKIKLDLTGETEYSWRIVAQNYEPDERANDIRCTDWSDIGGYSFYIDLTYPSFDSNFLLNDIYLDYFDLNMHSSEPLYYYPGQKIYVNYNESHGEFYDNILDLNQHSYEIPLIGDTYTYYSTDGVFNQYGNIFFTYLLEDLVQNVFIQRKAISFYFVQPGTYGNYSSPNNIATIEFENSNYNGNILIQEKPFNLNKENLNSITDLITINLNDELDYSLKFQINKLEEQYQESMNKLKIFQLKSDDSIDILETFYSSNYIYTNLSNGGHYGILYDENIIIEDEIPFETTILSCYPNPFNPNVTIQYELDFETEVDIFIYDISGRLVKTIEKTTKNPGKNKVIWNGVDNNGKDVSSGVYFIRMNYGEEHLTRKVTLMK